MLSIIGAGVAHSFLSVNSEFVRFSYQQDLSSSRPLGGSTLQHNASTGEIVYIFLSYQNSDIKKVSYYLNPVNKLSSRYLIGSSKASPYTTSYGVQLLQQGDNVLVTKVEFKSGYVHHDFALFRADPGPIGTAPTTTAPATTRAPTTSTTQPTTPQTRPSTTTTQPPVSNGSIWTPRPGTTWQWQLSGMVNTSVDAQVYDIDLFDTPQSTIDTLKTRGVNIVCYFSVHYENWRPDSHTFPTDSLGKNYPGWDGEKYVNWDNSSYWPIMMARLDLAKSKGCDGVEPDNVDQYSGTGFSNINRIRAERLVKDLASAAHSRGLSIGLKNMTDSIPALANYVDFAVNEECFQYDECNVYNVFIQQNKAVFGVEYEGNAETFCPKANQAKFSWLKKKLNLDATIQANCLKEY